jgi:hypothetical protein
MAEPEIQEAQSFVKPDSPSEEADDAHKSNDSSLNVEENINKLYSFLEKELGWSKEEIARRVKAHPEAHTVEQWFPHASQLFPGVFIYI